MAQSQECKRVWCSALKREVRRGRTDQQVRVMRRFASDGYSREKGTVAQGGKVAVQPAGIAFILPLPCEHLDSAGEGDERVVFQKAAKGHATLEPRPARSVCPTRLNVNSSSGQPVRRIVALSSV